eukprot:1191760-Prorocentrum_minimum.AAC.1
MPTYATRPPSGRLLGGSIGHFSTIRVLLLSVVRSLGGWYLEALPPHPDEQREEEEVPWLARTDPQNDQHDAPDDGRDARLDRVPP